MQKLVFSDRNTRMTTLVILVAILPTDILHDSGSINADLINIANANAMAGGGPADDTLFFAASTGNGKSVLTDTDAFFLLFLFHGLKRHHHTTTGYKILVVGQAHDYRPTLLPWLAVCGTGVPR